MGWIRGGLIGLGVGLICALLLIRPFVLTGLFPLTVISLIWLLFLGFILGIVIASEIKTWLKGGIIIFFYGVTSFIPNAYYFIQPILVLPTFFIVVLIKGFGLGSIFFKSSSESFIPLNVLGYIFVSIFYFLVGVIIGWIIGKIRNK